VDNFCLVFKSSGDYLLYVIGLWIAVCAVSTRFKRWFKKLEEAVKKSRLKRTVFGILLAAFCISLIAASVRIQLVQSKEQAEQQDPVRQEQLVLKFHTKSLAAKLLDFTVEYDKGSGGINEQQWYMGGSFDNLFSDKINDLRDKLSAESLDTHKLDDFIIQAEHTSHGWDRKPFGDEVVSISKELTNLSNQLPTTENRDENK
jgi:hypothetical protein